MTDTLLRGIGLMLVAALAFFLVSLRAAESDPTSSPWAPTTLERDALRGTLVSVD